MEDENLEKSWTNCRIPFFNSQFARNGDNGGQ